MKKIILALSIVFISGLAVAQQDVQYTHFMFSKLNFNPGYAGINDGICINGLARQQWMGYQNGPNEEGGAPNTYYLAAQSNIDFLSGGLGLVITNDQIGFEDNTSLRLAYSYHLNVAGGKLGIGLQAGFINKKLDFSKLRALDPSDPILLSTSLETAMNFDMSFGAYFKNDDFYAGLSSTQMQHFWGGSAEFATNLANPQYKSHYFLTGGYFYTLPNQSQFTINPNVLVKSDLAATQFDINVLAWYNNQVYGGVTYRATDAVAILVGYKKGSFMGGLSYDITTSPMRTGTFGTFEVYLKYCFTIVVPPKRERHGTVLYL